VRILSAFSCIPVLLLAGFIIGLNGLFHFASDWFRSTALGEWLRGLWDCCHGRHVWQQHETKTQSWFSCNFCQRQVAVVEKAKPDQAGIQNEAEPSCR
jgi:hypothetical protein